MKTSLPLTAVVLSSPELTPAQSPIPHRKSFSSVLEGLSGKGGLSLEKIEAKLLSGKVFSSQELIGLQIAAHRIGLSVECVSKVADGISSTIRKLQAQP